MSETMRSASPPYHYHLITVYTDCQACIRAHALSAARDEVVRAAVAWYGLESGAAVALGRAVAALARLEKP